jgi:hypothetical protein
MFSCAKINDNMKKRNNTILKFVVNHLQIFEYFKLMYLVRRVYVRFIRQQERHSFSVSFLGSYKRWGTNALHTKTNVNHVEY